MDCGPTCLRMIAKHYGKNFSLQRLREISGINREGVLLLGISEAAEKIGFRAMGSRLTVQQLGPGMQADAEIITKESSLLQRLLRNMTKMLNSGG